MKSSVVKYTSAIESNNAYTVTEPELRDVKSELDELIGVPSPKYFNGDTRATTNGFPTQFDAFSATQASTAAISEPWDHDPFGPVRPSDPFVQHDPFAPRSSSGNLSSVSPGFSSDPFGAVPFESEVAPALPPKKAPPRPAPPKNAPARPPPPMAKPPPRKFLKRVQLILI